MKKNFENFIETITNSIKAWDYFVDWNKVFSNSSDLEIVLNKLNFLLGKENLRESFYNLYHTNPDIIKAFPVLLAVREGNLDIFDAKTKNSAFFDITSNEHDASKYFEFLEKSGLVRLFNQDGVRNLVDYVIGVEVGLDSNARKNRVGTLMEAIVRSPLSRFCKQKGFKLLEQAGASAIKKEWNYKVKVDKSKRRFDFAIYNPKTNTLKLIETNFYHGAGSKLKAVCGEFKALYDELKAQNIDFIWITDGAGWHSMKNPLEETYNHNDYVFNLKMLESGVLEELEW